MELEKKTFLEIINNNLEGIWSDNIVIINVRKNKFNIKYIQDRPKSRRLVSEIGDIFTNEKEFYRVRELCYEEAIIELVKNDKIIRSPEIRKRKETCEGTKRVAWGGNIFETMGSEQEISINFYPPSRTIKEIVLLNLITQEEKEGTWLVFDGWEHNRG